jgi:hypothetical protein
MAAESLVGATRAFMAWPARSSAKAVMAFCSGTIAVVRSVTELFGQPATQWRGRTRRCK